MSKNADSLISYLRTVSGAWRSDPRDDAELLSQFANSRNDMAFATLVGRHGPMVWQTCRGVLGNTSDAEDAFQATFLAMARKISRISAGSITGWLHKVARRVSLDMQIAARRRQKLKQELRDISGPQGERDVDRIELYAVLDEELAGLPDRLRVPLLLRYVEGKTLEEVARTVGCCRRVLGRRLAKGETALRERLERRGLTLDAMSVTALLGGANTRALPPHLIESTAKAAVAFRAGTITGVTAEVAEKLVHSLSLNSVLWKSWWIVLASVGFFGIGGAGLVAWRMAASRSDPMEITSKTDTLPVSSATISSSLRLDAYGDPLPKDALARIGTVRFRGTGTDWRWVENRNDRANMNDRRWFKVALSPDGKILASSHDTRWRGVPDEEHGHVIRFWDIASGKQLHETVLKGAGADCRIAFSTDGNVLAAAKMRAVWLLDAVTGHLSEKPLSGSWPLVFTHDGKTLVCKTEGASFTLYDVGTRKPLRTLTVENLTPSEIRRDPWGTSLSFAVFSRDGRFLACIEEKGIVHLLDVKTGKKLAALKERQVRALVFTPDCSKLITAGQDKVIRIWDTKSGKELRQLGTMTGVPSLVDFLPDGKTALAACAGQVCYWDVTTGHEARPALDCKGLLCPQILSADGTKLIERVQDSLSIWDVASGKEISPVAGAPRSCMDCMTFSPDGKTLATHMGVSGESEIQLWEVATGKPLGSVATPVSAPNSCFWEIAWPSHNMLMARAFPNSSKFRSMIIQLAKKAAIGSIVEMQTYPDGVNFSPDGQVLARWRNQNVELFEVATGKKLATVPFPIPNPNELFKCSPAFSADHQFLATHSVYEPTITLWEVSTGRKLYSFNIPPIRFPDNIPMSARFGRLIGFSPDGRLVVTQDWITRAVSLWEHVSGHLRLRLAAPQECLNDDCNVAFSPDSRLLAIGYMIGSKEERSIHVWDLATGRECQQFHGHQAGGCGAPRVVFSPDGRRLASAGMDYTVLVWDVKQPSVLNGSSQPLDQQEMQTLKTALSGADAAAAYRAICLLRQVPEQAVPLASECLRPKILTPEAKRVAQEASRLIDDLDSDDFQTREKAEEELRKKLSEESGEPIIETVLRQALEKKPAVGVSKAIAQLLNEVAEERKWGGAQSPELVRMLRGIEVLELIHNDAACEVLQKVVNAPPRPEVRREAEAALRRLGASPLAPAMP